MIRAAVHHFAAADRMFGPGRPRTARKWRASQRGGRSTCMNSATREMILTFLASSRAKKMGQLRGDGVSAGSDNVGFSRFCLKRT